MSLVYEALQKAEREKHRSAGTAPVPSLVTPVQAHPPEVVKPVVIPVSALVPPPSKHHGYLATLVACVSLVALAAIVYVVMIATRSSPETRATAPAPALPASAVSPEPPPPAPAPVTPPANPTANDSRFRLTAIMGKPEGGFGAVINGHVVYEEQYVDGAIVKKVERDRVTLNIDGREIIVRLF